MVIGKDITVLTLGVPGPQGPKGDTGATGTLPVNAGPNQILGTKSDSNFQMFTLVGSGITINFGASSITLAANVSSITLAMPSEFSVSGSPLTSAGTITVSKVNQDINKVYAGPSSGVAAQPGFRTLVNNDLPVVDIAHGGTALSSIIANNKLLGSNGSTYQAFTIAASTGIVIDYSGGTISISATGGSGVGSVTSVGLASPAEFTVSGSPITTSGTLTLTKANQNANKVWAGPTTGADAQPTFRTLVNADLPVVDIPHGGLNLTAVPAASAILGAKTDGTQAYQGYELVAGSKISITYSGSTITFTNTASGAGSGSVTSVGLTMPSDFSVANTPIIDSGTFNVTRTSQSANLVLASPDNSAGTPSYRALVNRDLPVVDVAHGGLNLTAVPAATALVGAKPDGTQGYQGYSLNAGSNVTITYSGSAITIASTGGGSLPTPGETLLTERRHVVFQPTGLSVSTGVTYGGGAIQSQGTAQTSVIQNGRLVRGFLSGSTSGNNVFINTTTFSTAVVLKPTASFVVSFSRTTDARYWIGIGNPNPAATDTPVSFIAFRYSTAAGDSTWKAYTSTDGGVTTVEDTGVSISANTPQWFFIDLSDGTNAKFYIDGVLKKTISTNLPGSTTQVIPVIFATTLTNSALTMFHGRVFHETY